MRECDKTNPATFFVTLAYETFPDFSLDAAPFS